MKYLWIATMAFTLSNCNTMIGLGRDITHGIDWATQKAQGTGGGGEDTSGAPIY